MKRFYYNVEEFTPESESKLGQSQESNDEALIKVLFHDYKLHSMYEEKERNSAKIDYVGHLDYQLYNWEGEQIEWIEHTLELFFKELESSKKAEIWPANNLDELDKILKWLKFKLEDAIIQYEILSEPIVGRIKWIGTPSQFGYVFLELIDKGYIKPPKHKNGKMNCRKFAKICFNVFDIIGEEATLVKELTPKSKSLDPSNQAEFNIPLESKLIIPNIETIS
jgi:hypothetical protein